MNERRVARRYDVAVQVLVSEAGLRRLDRPRGLTRDISTNGLYFTMAEPPRPGSRVELTLTLPGFLTGSNDVIVEVVGRVVRVDNRGTAPAEDRMDAPAGSGAHSPAVAHPVAPYNRGAGVTAGLAPAAAVGVAAQIEKYDIIRRRLTSKGFASAF
jgi:hypothetical protein